MDYTRQEGDIVTGLTKIRTNRVKKLRSMVDRAKFERYDRRQYDGCQYTEPEMG